MRKLLARERARRRLGLVGMIALLVVGVPAAIPTAGAAGEEFLVINEIDYDQPSTDIAEYLEIKNKGASAVNLDNVSVVFINGNAGGALNYRTLDLPHVSVAADGYYVICANAANTTPCTSTRHLRPTTSRTARRLRSA